LFALTYTKIYTTWIF